MAASGKVLSRWYTMIDGFNTSALDFYTAVEKAVRAREVPDVVFERIEFPEGGVGSPRRQYLRVRRQRVAFDIGAAPYGVGYFFSWWLLRLHAAHPWIWLFVFLLALAGWSAVLLASATAMLPRLAGSGGSGSGCFFLIVLLSLPVAIIGLGWSTREGYIFDEEEVLAIPVIGWLYERIFNPSTYHRHDTAAMFQESIRRAVNDVIEGLISEQGLRALSEEDLKPTTRELPTR